MKGAATQPGKEQTSRFVERVRGFARDWWYVAAAVAFATWVVASTNAGTSAGADAKDFAFVAYQGHEYLGGQESRLASVLQQGRPVVLNFWAGLCSPCRAEMPAFQRVADRYGDSVIFLGVDVGVFTGLGDHTAGQRLLGQLGITYPAAYAVDASALRLYEVRGMPTTVFLTPQGRIVERVDGMLSEAHLERVVARLVAASS